MFNHCDELRNSFSVVGKNDVRITPRHSSSGVWPGHFFKFELNLNFGELDVCPWIEVFMEYLIIRWAYDSQLYAEIGHLVRLLYEMLGYNVFSSKDGTVWFNFKSIYGSELST